MHLGAVNQSDVGDGTDVLSAVAAVSLHLASRALTRQRGVPGRLSLWLLRHGDLLHF